MNLLQELIRRGVLDQKTANSIEYEVQSSNQSLTEVLLRKGSLSEEKLFRIKSEVEKTPLKRVYSEEVSNEALQLIPQNTAEQHRMVPIGRKEGRLQVGMVEPNDIEARETLNFLARQGGFSFDIHLITPGDYQGVMNRYRGLKKVVSRALSRLKTEKTEEGREETEGVKEERPGWGRLVEEAPISKVVDVLLRHALEGEASDVHVEPFGDKLRVRFRVLGELYSSIFLPKEYLAPLVARVKILSSLRIDESRIPQDGRFSKVVRGRKIDFRVSTLPTGQGEKVAIRILDPRTGLRSFGELGLVERNLRIVEETIKNNSGLILVTGPTGSGKTTTLYAILQNLNREGSNIVTLEDPIEYFIEGVNQSQIKPSIGFSFAQGLRHVLRQDPDIIMVGEVRDPESADLTVHASLTGHLVLSTLHTTSSFGAIPRLIDLGVDPYLIPVVLRVVAAQRLVRRLCDDCKRQREADEKEVRVIENELEGVSSFEGGTIRLWEAVGCRECGGRGFSDRIGVFEVLKMTDRLSEIIVQDGGNEDRILKEARRQGAVTMRQDAVLKALDGMTTLEEALRITKSD